uniref:Uncharacterized protein n=1 Tax=Bracon brevicornis TaxID=1563983 RepID=A0A6V7JXJ8_9HYME
MHKPDDEAD